MRHVLLTTGTPPFVQGMSAYTATSGTLSAACGRISFTFGLKVSGSAMPCSSKRSLLAHCGWRCSPGLCIGTAAPVTLQAIPSLPAHPVQGPSVSIDTACSSSLVGVHLACSSFLPDGCPRALAAGVNLTLRAETTAVLSKAGMLALDGRCKTLDAAADGYMRGEACVVHLLETALQDSPEGQPSAPAAAVILGTAVNQDGRSSSLTAPNGPSQQAVLQASLIWQEVAAAEVAALEMHGTGTALGDPIEVGAAFAVYQASCCCCRLVLCSDQGFSVPKHGACPAAPYSS